MERNAVEEAKIVVEQKPPTIRVRMLKAFVSVLISRNTNYNRIL